MKRFSFLAMVLLSVPMVGQAASPENGKAVYDKWCVHCHGIRVKSSFPGTSDAMYPGTAALALKYKGQQPAVLIERTNLTPEFVKTIVRNGVYAMPRTRKTEISDAELDDVAAYLTRKK